MRLGSFVPIVLSVVAGLALPQPGQLRVPKVYNAVITSNQNLAPSRAYPVIQPVVHRTAIGYVPPPYYYTPIPPGYGGPGVVQLQPGAIGPREQPPTRPDDVESVETTDGGSPTKRVSRPTSKIDKDDSSVELSSDSSEESSATDKSSKKEKSDRVPLSFYPNYQSLYYDPYFYPYNAFPPHLAAPGTYYVDYPQPPGILGPLPPLPPPGAYPIPSPGRPESTPEASDKEPNVRTEKQKARSSERRDKIPDVPAPPVPTATRKKTT